MKNFRDLGGGRKKAGRGEVPGLSWEERDGEINGKREGRQGALQDTRSVKYLPPAPGLELGVPLH